MHPIPRRWFNARSHSAGEMVPLLLCACWQRDQRRKGTRLQFLQTLIYIKAPRGILQSLSIPRAPHWLCPAMQWCSRPAQLLSDLEGLKSRSKAGSGLMKGKLLWKQIRTGSQTVTNKIINGMTSLPVFPSFVSFDWRTENTSILEHILMLNTVLMGFLLLSFYLPPLPLATDFCKELQNSVLLFCLNS